MQRNHNKGLCMRSFSEFLRMPQVVVYRPNNNLVNGQWKSVEQGFESVAAQHREHGIPHGNDVCSPRLAQNQTSLTKTHARTDFVVEHQLTIGASPRNAQAPADQEKHFIGGIILTDHGMTAVNLLQLQGVSQRINDRSVQLAKNRAGEQYVDYF